MLRILNRLPYPIAGIMLSVALLGNIMGSLFGNPLKYGFVLLSGFILMIIILKIIVNPKSLITALNTLPIASVMATLPMGIMILATYIKNIQTQIAIIVWFAGLILNVFIILFFTIKHVFPLKIEKILASYFVAYVGIVCASVTSITFNMDGIGKVVFLFGLIVYIILFPIVSYSYLKSGVKKELLMPLITIYAAPANLLVVGYLSLGINWAPFFIVFLWGLGMITTIFGWYRVFRLRSLKFYPSFSAYTFPFVIGAVATLSYGRANITNTTTSTVLNYIGYIQLVVSLLLVMYVFLSYINYLFKGDAGTGLK